MSAEGFTCPPDHKHALTGTCGRNHGCKCAPCRSMHAAEMRRRRRLAKKGVVAPKFSPVGVQRRMQALMAVGWSVPQMAEHMGVNRSTPHRWLGVGWTTARTHGQIDRMYRDLWNKKPPTTNMPERVGYVRTIEHARREGYLPPLAWDDIDNDPVPPPERWDADRQVDDLTVELVYAGDLPVDTLTTRERSALAALALDRGWAANAVYAHFGVHAQRQAIKRRDTG